MLNLRRSQKYSARLNLGNEGERERERSFQIPIRIIVLYNVAPSTEITLPIEIARYWRSANKLLGWKESSVVFLSRNWSKFMYIWINCDLSDAANVVFCNLLLSFKNSCILFRAWIFERFLSEKLLKTVFLRPSKVMNVLLLRNFCKDRNKW